MPSLYEALGAESEATLADLKACFKRRALSVHPDKQGGSKEAFQLVYAAFERLSDPVARAKYDQALRASSSNKRLHPHSATRGPKRCKRPRAARSSPSCGGNGKDNTSNKSNRGVTDISSNNNHTSNSRRHRSGNSNSNFNSKIIVNKLRAGRKTRHSHGMEGGSEDERRKTQGDNNNSSNVASNMQSSRPGTKEEIRILCRIHRLLKQQTRTEREQIVSGVLSQELRVALTDWVIASRSAQPGDPSPSISKRLCTRGSTEDDVASSSSGSSEISDDEDLEQECELLAVCDSTCEVDPALNPRVLCDDACVDDPEFKVEGAGIDYGSKEQDPKKASRGASEVRNISCQQVGGKLYYKAQMSMGILSVKARSSTDLAVAVDHLILLTALKRQALCADDVPGGSSVGAKTIVERTRLAYEQIKGEAGAEAFADLAAIFCLQLGRKYWIGRHSIYTPAFRSLDGVLPTWLRFLNLQLELIQDGAGHFKGTAGYLNRLSPARLEEHWNHFKQIYLDAWGVVSAHEMQRQLDRVEAMVAANVPYREKKLQNWNLRRMRREERNQRRLKRAPPAERAERLAARWADLRAKRLLRQRAAAARGLDQRRRRRLREAQLAQRRAKAERRERWQRLTGQGSSMEKLWARGETNE
ncbi:unnamed protein product [Polarella glacialis]|uniref:J domain-containing protein n=1 Tax=Polarella glacialis TaxID=89957 RepID=A0A813H935_POLGL|nr:unnamed protein product [Polarella glacialis]